MRIVSGKFKGRRIYPPKQLPVRPTTDLAKEALFNILNNTYYFDEITVTDLFAGTGSISYEFASRGALRVTSVDRDHKCIKFISQTTKDFNMPIHPVRSDAYTYLEKAGIKSTIIFADPPYGSSPEQFARIPQLIFEKDLLEQDGLLIIEHAKQTDLSQLEYFSNSRNYGGSVFSFFTIK
jgi:16S rRNA (guanine(966)-N(2))-methyltransferase RsmD